jgi:hypothetical protein
MWHGTQEIIDTSETYQWRAARGRPSGDREERGEQIGPGQIFFFLTKN